MPKKARVTVQRDGRVRHVPPSQVDYALINPTVLFDATGTLIPFLYNTQGNRSLMATNHLTQAQSLKGRELLLVQVRARGKTSYEDPIGA